MNKDNMKTFTTGQFAERFKIKKDTLFYYDKIGLFKPEGIGDNGYRYYTVPQLDIFWMLRSLRELNFPIKTLQNYLDTPTPEELVELSNNQLIKVKEEIKKLEQINWLLNSVVTNSNEAINAPLDEVTLVNLPSEPIVYSKPLPYIDDISFNEWFEFYDNFLNQTNLKGPAYVGSIVSKDDLLKNKFGTIHQLFVRMEGEGIKPAGLYAVTYHKGPYETAVDVYKVFVAKIKKQGLTICGDAYEEYLLNRLAVSNPNDFIIKISIAVKK